jgi:hypothetical protein
MNRRTTTLFVWLVAFSYSLLAQAETNLMDELNRIFNNEIHPEMKNLIQSNKLPGISLTETIQYPFQASIKPLAESADSSSFPRRFFVTFHKMDKIDPSIFTYIFTQTKEGGKWELCSAWQIKPDGKRIVFKLAKDQ